MYSILNPVDHVVKSGEKFAMDNDRALYNGFMKTIEEYCIENEIIIGGNYGIEMLTGKPVSISSYSFDLYSDDTFNHARKLADALYASRTSTPHIDARTISVESKIKHQLFNIWVNQRILVRMKKIGMYRNVKLVKLINPMKLPARFATGEVLCMSSQMQLISIYQKLYNPFSSFGSEGYTAFLEIENTLYNTMVDRKKNVTGGKSLRIDHRDFADILEDIMEELLMSTKKQPSSNVLIGDYALEGNKVDSRKRLQMLIKLDDVKPSETIDDISHVVRNIVVDRIGKRYDVESIKYDLRLPTDIYLSKYTFYISDKKSPTNKSQQVLCDIFNTPSYEAIPYYFSNVFGMPVKTAGDFVLMRFKLLDLYALQLIVKLGTSNNEYLERKIDNIRDDLEFIRQRAYKNIKSDPFKVFQLTNYEGVFIEENILTKKITSQYKFMFSRYYPSLKDTPDNAI